MGVLPWFIRGLKKGLLFIHRLVHLIGSSTEQLSFGDRVTEDVVDDDIIKALDDSDVDFLDDDDDDADPNYVPVEPVNSNQNIDQVTRDMLWKNCESFDTNIALLGDQEWEVGNREFFTPLDYFEQYIPDDFYELTSDQSNRPHMQENPTKQLKSTPVEYKQVVCAHIFLRSHSCHATDCSHSETSCTCWIICQLQKKKSNPLWKVQPIYDVVRNKCKQLP
ncbi:hypothetical protein PR048_017928 [Dryococelus australis]|uniref:Uncharacterized protein n=1 Tax=Dryococelus australis TaxID=614101 RepID=A0ABQ9HAU2_9NEOP|nr:hypothetical protein PR048_017928 [Dryococelus australis]